MYHAEILLYDIIPVVRLAVLNDLAIRQLVHTALSRDTDLAADLLSLGIADAMDIGQCDHDPLIGRDVNTSDTSHSSSPAHVRESLKAALTSNTGGKCPKTSGNPPIARQRRVKGKRGK